MKLSNLSFRVSKNPPANADTANHRLLTQAGYVRQLMAGVYTYTPLGLRVLRKIEAIIREEMDAIGGQEILMPALHPKANWQTTGGWDKIDVLFKLKSRTDKDYALGQSHEEIVTPLAKEVITSYKDLPLALYQIQWKYRDELRSKSGIMRGREFFMKDMYSFHTTQDDFDQFYATVKAAYLRIFARLGLTAKVTEASGGSFTEKVSYEFMVLTDAGEDDIFYCEACDYCVNSEIAKVKAGDACPKCGKALQAGRAAEVGNVFDLGQKFAKDFELSFADEQGHKQFPIMGCYGIGVSRCMGVIVEKYNDERGIIWPESIAPATAIILAMNGAEDYAQEVYQALQAQGTSVLLDDRSESAGSKFAGADLLGIPVRLVVSTRNGQQIEWKKRQEEQVELLDLNSVLERLKK
jgi:prolyl-tRNA synthetase